MGDQKQIFVIESNGFAVMQIRDAVARYGFGAQVEIVPDAGDVADFTVIRPTSPVRVGRVLDQITSALMVQGQGDDVLSVGSGRYVDVALGLYYEAEDGEPVRLTEKEVALFVLLAQAKGEAVSRETLLEDAWQYADGVETHTLETHIYRLRQKIEKDPTIPQILQTSEAGYFLSLEDI